LSQNLQSTLIVNISRSIRIQKMSIPYIWNNIVAPVSSPLAPLFLRPGLSDPAV